MMNSTDIIQRDSSVSSIIGSPQAHREIRFFVDYGSTASIYANASMNQLLIFFEDDLKILVKHQPSVLEDMYSEKAAEACVCAAMEGLFLAMHEKLLMNQRRLGIIALSVYAHEIGLQNQTFLHDIVYGVYKRFVRQDMLEASRWTGYKAPFFVLNDKAYPANTNVEILKSVILRMK